jgi:hypothetical protein
VQTRVGQKLQIRASASIKRESEILTFLVYVYLPNYPYLLQFSTHMHLCSCYPWLLFHFSANCKSVFSISTKSVLSQPCFRSHGGCKFTTPSFSRLEKMELGSETVITSVSSPSPLINSFFLLVEFWRWSLINSFFLFFEGIN